MHRYVATGILSLCLGCAFTLGLAAEGESQREVQQDAAPRLVVHPDAGWNSIVLNVARAAVRSDSPSFHAALRYWESGWLQSGSLTLRSDEDLKTPCSFANAGAFNDEESAILINGDCLADVTVEGSALILIRGNLAAKLTVRDMSEIVIGGSILAGGSIEASGIVDTFVGGDMLGSVGAFGSQTLWIEGSVKGSVRFNGLRAHIGRDCTGQFDPSGGLGALFLDIAGFMPQQALTELAKRTDPSFEASVALGDADPGLYSAMHEKRWVVHQRASDDYIAKTRSDTR